MTRARITVPVPPFSAWARIRAAAKTPEESSLCFSLSVRPLPKLATALVKAGAEARARVRRSLSSRLRWFAASTATIFVPELAIAAAYMAWLLDVLSMKPTPLLSPTPGATARGLLNLDGSRPCS
jgi:hypothetical protein